MRRTFLLFTIAAAMLVACTGVVLAQQAATPDNQHRSGGKLPPPGHAKRACSEPTKQGYAQCHALVRDDVSQPINATGQSSSKGGETTGASAAKQASPASSSGPSGYWPGDLQSAYNLTTLAASGANGATVAIVDAYDDPRAESDLQTYRSQFGLPACTTANGCFQKVKLNTNNQPVTGSKRAPRANTGWAEEISLDLDMVSAICPSCHIQLVESYDNSFNHMAGAVNYAAKQPGVVAISNSYGGSEFSSETSYDSYYNHPGKAITVSSGDNGYGVEYPAASKYVTAVGGTALNRDSSSTRGWNETAWSKAGSGCSAYEPSLTWQQTNTGCAGNRIVADVAANADPNTGVAVYDSYNEPGWMVFGGTSVASPIIASVYALAGNSASINDGSYSYGHITYGTTLWDVTSGSNGSCGGIYLCTGDANYDGPTGNGTPDGTGGF
jgi:subtilase family serine protease